MTRATPAQRAILEKIPDAKSGECRVTGTLAKTMYGARTLSHVNRMRLELYALREQGWIASEAGYRGGLSWTRTAAGNLELETPLSNVARETPLKLKKELAS